MLNARIFIEDLKCMWKIQDKKFQKYLMYNIIYSYIVSNDGHGYGTSNLLFRCVCTMILLQVGGGI